MTVHVWPDDPTPDALYAERVQELSNWLNILGEYAPNMANEEPLHPSIKAVLGNDKSSEFYRSLRNALGHYGRLTPRQVEAGLSMMDRFVQSTSEVVAEANRETTGYAFERGFRGEFQVYVLRSVPYRSARGDGFVNVGETVEGHQVVYSGGTAWAVGDWMTIVASVLDHVEYQGVAQTKLSRVQIVNTTPAL
jgi:hypothetical protein